VSLFRAALKAFTSNSAKWIYYKEYGLKDKNKKKLRMPKKADNVGFGFKLHSKQVIFRQVINSLEHNLDFIRNSRLYEDQYLAFVPDQKRFDYVRDYVAYNWHLDEFFCNELLNGVNPFSC